jgi:hypothetical protein
VRLKCPDQSRQGTAKFGMASSHLQEACRDLGKRNESAP